MDGRRSHWKVILAVLGAILINEASSSDELLTRDVLAALEHVLRFYERDYRSVNLDGVFGLRFAEGALLSVLKDENAGHLTVSKDRLQQIRQLSTRASMIAKQTLPNLERGNPAYFKKFKEQVSVPWTNFKSFHKIDDQLYVPVNKRNYLAFDEDTSDRCMLEVKGQVVNSKRCLISDHCWDLMTAQGTDGYTLTHQALYLLIGEEHGCENQMQERLRQSNIKGGLQKMYDRICASMYPQMMEIEQKRTLLDSSLQQRDLYLEQAMICGSMGYPEFLSNERLQNILSWQRDDGCFGDVRRRPVQLLKDDRVSRDPRDMSELTREYAVKRQMHARKMKRTNTMRSLLMEKVLEDGCMSHVTGVAVGLLGVYVRWMMYSPGLTFPQKTSDDELRTYLVEDTVKHNEREYTVGYRNIHRVVLQHQALLPLSKTTTTTLSRWLVCAFVLFPVVIALAYYFKRMSTKVLKLRFFTSKDTHHII